MPPNRSSSTASSYPASAKALRITSGAVVPDGAGGQLDAVAHDVVLVGVDRERIFRLQGFQAALRHREGVVGEGRPFSSSSFHSYIGKSTIQAELEAVLVDERQLASDAGCGRGRRAAPPWPPCRTAKKTASPGPTLAAEQMRASTSAGMNLAIGAPADGGSLPRRRRAPRSRARPSPRPAPSRSACRKRSAGCDAAPGAGDGPHHATLVDHALEGP